MAVSNHSSPYTQWHRPQRTWESVFFLFTGAPLTTQLNARLRASFQSPKQDWLQLPTAFHTVWLPHHLHPVGRMDLSSSSKYCERRKQSFPKDGLWPWSSLLERHRDSSTTAKGSKIIHFIPLLWQGIEERSSFSNKWIRNSREHGEPCVFLIGV